MARRRGKKGRRGKASIPLAVVAPLGIVVLKDIEAGGGPSSIANRIVEDVTGYNVIGKKFTASEAMPFWIGSLVGIVVHKVAGKTGVNKHVKKLTMGYFSV